MNRKTYNIIFFDRGTAGLFLYELRQWGVRESRYALNKYTFTTKDPNVVDVCTESFKPVAYKIEEALTAPERETETQKQVGLIGNQCSKCGHLSHDPRRRGSDKHGSFCIPGCGCACGVFVDAA